MPQETTNVMTTYEIIATVIAILALLQPWIIKLWDRFGRKFRVNFIPSAKIKLYYNRSGAYVYLGGVIEAKNKAAVVKDIAVKVVRKKDKAELLLDWSSFMIPVFQSVGGNAVTTNEIARPFKGESGSLYPVFIEFASTNIQESNRLTEIYNTIALELAGIMQPNITIEQAKYALAMMILSASSVLPESRTSKNSRLIMLSADNSPNCSSSLTTISRLLRYRALLGTSCPTNLRTSTAK